MKNKGRILHTLLILLLSPILIVVTAAVLLYIPPIQQWAVKQAAAYASQETGLDIKVGGVYISFPLDIDLQDLTVKKDGQHVASLDNAIIDLDFTHILSLQLGVEAVDLKGADINTLDLIESMRLKGKLNTLHLTADNVDLNKHHVNLNGAAIAGCDLDIAFYETPEDTTTSEPSQWTLSLEDITLLQSRIALHTIGDSLVMRGILQKAKVSGGDANLHDNSYKLALLDLTADSLFIDYTYEPRAPRGFDANHIALSNVDFGVKNLVFLSDPLKLDAQFARGKFTEQSGIQLGRLAGYIHLCSNNIRAKGLDIQTSSSSLAGDIDMDFNTFTPGEHGQMNVNINGSLGYTDMIALAADALPKGLPHQPVNITMEADGNVDLMNTTRANITMPTVAEVKMNGTVRDMLNSNRLGADLDIDGQTQNLDWLRNAMQMNDVHFPPMSLSGDIHLAEGHHIQTDAVLHERKGHVHLVGKADLKDMTYKANVKIASLRLHDFLPRQQIYDLTAHATAEGSGTDFLSPSTRLIARAKIDDLTIGTNRLTNMGSDLSLRDGKVLLDITSDNPLLGVNACAEAKLDHKIDDATFSIDMHRIDLYSLGVTERPFSASMILNLDGSTNLRDTHQMRGSMRALELVIADTVLHPLDLDVSLLADPTQVEVGAHAGDLQLSLKSEQCVDSLLLRTNTFLANLEKNLSSHTATKDTMQTFLPYLSLNLDCGDRNPIGNMLRVYSGFSFKHLGLNISCRPEEGLRTNGRIQSFNTRSIVLDTIRWNATPKDDGLHFNAAICNSRRNRVATFTSHLNGKFTETGIETAVDFYDASGRKGIDFGVRATKSDSAYRVEFTTLRPIIAFRQFTLNKDNFLELQHDGRLQALVNLLADDGTGLKLYSTPNEAAKQDLSLTVNRLNIGELTESLPFMPNLKGYLHGDVHYMQADSTSTISVDMEVDNLVYNNVPLGNMGDNSVYLPNADGTHYVDGFLTHEGNEIASLTGHYAESGNESQMEGEMDITQLPLMIANAFLPENLITLDGYVNGNLSVLNSDLNGVLNTDNMHIIERDFNINLRVPNDAIEIENSVVRLKNLKAYASETVSPMTLDGYVDLAQGTLDMALKAKNYPIINAPKTKGSSGYGKMFVDIDATARGALNRMRINGNLKLLGNTDFNYVLDDSPISVEDQLADLVEFVDFTDTTEVEEVEVITRDDIDMQMNVTVEQAAQLHCILSRDGSDRIDLQGGGDLVLTYDSRNDLRLYGRYTVLDGTMRYSIMGIPLNNFKLKNGSYVEFTGNISNPLLNVEANSRMKASVNDGDKPRNVPFNVGLALSQTLENMGLQFTIDSPEDLATQNELSTMSEEERSRMAVTMLVTGMYMSNNFDITSGYNYTNTLNSFLQSAINRVAGKAVSTIDLNFGIENSTTQSGAQTTDYSFSFAKRFWGNRISLVIGGKVSSGKEAVNNGMTIINNVSIEYRLDKTATRYVRLYYDRNHESLIEGELTEMGAGLVFHRKSDRMGDLFIFKKDELLPEIKKKKQKEAQVIENQE